MSLKEINLQPSNLSRYCIYSILVHIALGTSILWISISQTSVKNYYMVDFLGAGIGSAGGGMKSGSQTPAPEPENLPEPTVNPKDDLLLKAKSKKSKKEKEKKKKEKKKEEKKKTSIPIPAAPAPRLLPKKGEVSSIPSAIPGGQGTSGVGIGFGDTEGSGFGGGGTSNFPYTWYVHSVKKRLDSNWNITSGYSTKIYTQVAFTIQRNGTVLKVKVEESSKDEIFDQAARRAVEYSHPLPPLPRDFPEDELRVHVRFTVKR